MTIVSSDLCIEQKEDDVVVEDVKDGDEDDDVDDDDDDNVDGIIYYLDLIHSVDVLVRVMIRNGFYLFIYWICYVYYRLCFI